MSNEQKALGDERIRTLMCSIDPFLSDEDVVFLRKIMNEHKDGLRVLSTRRKSDLAVFFNNYITENIIDISDKNSDVNRLLDILYGSSTAKNARRSLVNGSEVKTLVKGSSVMLFSNGTELGSTG